MRAKGKRAHLISCPLSSEFQDRATQNQDSTNASRALAFARLERLHSPHMLINSSLPLFDLERWGKREVGSRKNAT